jgi:hypothetical protein
MKAPSILAPLRYSDFRLLWAGVGASYAGDRLQEMSQAWLVASLTSSSALAVGTIGITATFPQLFMPDGENGELLENWLLFSYFESATL